MAIAILILFTLALYHFVLEGMLVPAGQKKIKYQLFRLRDDLRNLKLEKPTELEDEWFDYMDNSINNAIRLVPLINLSLIYKAIMDIQLNSNIARSIALNNHAIQSHKLSSLKQIDNRMVRCLKEALVLNVSGWYIYVLPVIFLFISFTYLFKSFRNKVYKPLQLQLSRLPHTPEKEIRRMFPEFAYGNPLAELSYA